MGRNQYRFLRYDVVNNTWESKANPPWPYYVEEGGALITDGTYIYAFVGNGNNKFYRYNPADNTWTTLTDVPRGVSYGADFAYDGSDTIYATTGGYQSYFYKYSISQATWTRIADVPLSTYYGSSIEYYNGNIYYTRGAWWRVLYKFTIDSSLYKTSATYISQAQDLTYVSSWSGLTATTTTPAGTSITFYTRTSTDNANWSSWEQVSEGTIASPTRRYIQVKVVLSSNGSATPIVSDFTISYLGDTISPSNPTSVRAYSEAKRQIPIVYDSERNRIYALLRGSNSKKFSCYDISSGSWTQLNDTPQA
jgi:N-acetylneuraminic acid mutarotase